MTFNHVHVIKLDPHLSGQVDRLLAFLERMDAGMTPEEEAAVAARARGQADRLHAAADEPDPK